MLTFDIETDALLRNLTKIHCGWIHDETTNNYLGFHGSQANEFSRLLLSSDCICGHNIVQFDIPAIRKLFPWFNPKGKIYDTAIMSRLLCPDIYLMTMTNKVWAERTPKKLWSSHSLEAWGYRLGILKGTYGKSENAWKEFNSEMYEYCKQDVAVTRELFSYLMSLNYLSESALDLEVKVATIISRQECYGVCFNETKAWTLYRKLCEEKEEVLRTLRTIFPARRKLIKKFVAKVNNSRLGYVKGQLIEKYEDIEFNPGSNQQVYYWLNKRHGWEPSEFTETGEPKIDEEILEDIIDLPEVPMLLRYRMLTKRISQLTDGDMGWLKRLLSTGRIHGSVIPSGAVTRRMTHNTPNLAQVPKADKSVPFGAECRELFEPPPGMVMVGCDAAQLELRTMAHLLFQWDCGAYVRAAISGTKENNDDIHCINALAFGVDRNLGKTIFYALVYGAGDEKLGRTKTKSWNRVQNRRVGKQLRENLLKNLPALKKLLDTIQSVYKSRGYFVDADGQKFKLRSTHSAFNTINQRLGAIIMKRAQVFLDGSLQESGLVPGVDYEFMLTVHDEWQIASLPQHAEFIGKTAVASIKKAGEFYGLKCPLDGDYRIGKNWYETH